MEPLQATIASIDAPTYGNEICRVSVTFYDRVTVHNIQVKRMEDGGVRVFFPTRKVADGQYEPYVTFSGDDFKEVCALVKMGAMKAGYDVSSRYSGGEQERNHPFDGNHRRRH